MNICAIVQARTNSTRLYNKIFLDLAGKPLIWHVINRLSYSNKIKKIVLATTTNPSDDKLEDWAKLNGIAFFRGEEDNVLARFYKCAKEYNADIIVRVTADDPFKDPYLIDKLIEQLQTDDLDFIFNNYPPSFPEGLDVEIFNFKSLEISFFNSNSNFEKEHVTQYFYRNLNLFKTKNILNSQNLSKYRWTIDTIEDYQMVNQVYKTLFQENKIFLTEEIINLVNSNPILMNINSDVQRSQMYK